MWDCMLERLGYIEEKWGYMQVKRGCIAEM
jgi:hypothetical protein